LTFAALDERTHAVFGDQLVTPGASEVVIENRGLTRSLDLLHVAAAQVMMCSASVSADDRQRAVAKAAAFKVVDIKHPARREKS
jgi:hypothetical protein